MILQVLKDTHPKLKKIASPADPLRAHHRTLARRLVETMKAHGALGIAANQVNPGELVRIIAVNTKDFKGAMFNPEIIEKSEATDVLKEGCLSTKQRIEMTRPITVKVKFFTIGNEEKTLEFNGLDSHVVQHEIDHLFGKVISDFMIK
jgi:peptide deformylase